MKEKDKHNIVRQLLKEKDSIPELKIELSKLYKPGYYNILLYMHLGDDFFRAAMKDDLEKLYGSIHFIIKPSDEILMKLWDIDCYTIFDVDKFLDNYIINKTNISKYVFDYYRCACLENTISCEPNPNEVFILFPLRCNYNTYVRALGRPTTIVNWLNAGANILKKSKINIEKLKYPVISETLQNKLDSKNLDINKIVLFAPETRSDDLLDIRFWNQLATNIENLGYTIVENVTYNENHIKGAINLNLTLEELVCLGMNCKSVFSIRSGLCDLLIGKRNNLYIFYSEERFKEIYHRFGLKNIYDYRKKAQPREIVLSNNMNLYLEWNGVNIFKDIKTEYLPDSIQTKEKFIEKIFSIKNDKKSHKVIKLCGIKIKFKYDKKALKLASIQKNYKMISKKLKMAKRKINVIFLVYQNSKWKTQSLYDMLANDPNFNVKILLTIADFQIFYTHNERIKILEKNYAFFKSRNMDVEYAWNLNSNRPISLEKWNPDIVFYQAPYSFDPLQHLFKVSEQSLCCYLPYYINQTEDFTLMNTQYWHKCLYRWYVLDEYWQNVSTNLLGGDPYKRIKPVGHTMLDCYNNEIQHPQESKHYVIYAAHWSVGQEDGLSTFLETGPFMLEYARKHPEINWVFTYHPSLTFNIVDRGYMSKEEILGYYDEWRKIAYVHDEGDYIDLFKNSDLLISDCGSFRVEYFPTGKPYIYLISNNSKRYKDGSFLDKICKYYYKTYNIEQLEKNLNMLLINKEDPLKKAREENVNSLPFLKTNAAKNIVDDLYKILNLHK